MWFYTGSHCCWYFWWTSLHSVRSSAGRSGCCGCRTSLCSIRSGPQTCKNHKGHFANYHQAQSHYSVGSKSKWTRFKFSSITQKYRLLLVLRLWFGLQIVPSARLHRQSDWEKVGNSTDQTSQAVLIKKNQDSLTVIFSFRNIFFCVLLSCNTTKFVTRPPFIPAGNGAAQTTKHCSAGRTSHTSTRVHDVQFNPVHSGCCRLTAFWAFFLHFLCSSSIFTTQLYEKVKYSFNRSMMRCCFIISAYTYNLFLRPMTWTLILKHKRVQTHTHTQLIKEWRTYAGSVTWVVPMGTISMDLPQNLFFHRTSKRNTKQ